MELPDDGARSPAYYSGQKAAERHFAHADKEAILQVRQWAVSNHESTHDYMSGYIDQLNKMAGQEPAREQSPELSQAQAPDVAQRTREQVDFDQSPDGKNQRTQERTTADPGYGIGF